MSEGTVAMGRMKDLYITIYGGGEDAVEAARKLLDSGGWIPVSEGLPADRSRVLVAMMGVVWPATYRPDTKKKFVLEGSDKFQRINFFSSISHWMPFPEPPRWPPP